jgi:ribosomal protein S18 acetylase RimI-like enzyme
MFQIRQCEPKDVDAVYEVCLKTGDAGQDATHLFKDPKALGHLFVGPYMALEPNFAFVLEDNQGVCGYTLGALDTLEFQKRYLMEWLPPLQEKYPDPIGHEHTWTEDEKIYHQLHHPDLKFPDMFKSYPSHLHIDLLPRAQAQGQGKGMMNTLLTALVKAGSSGVHLGLYARNQRAFHFYSKLGFQVLESNQESIHMGKHL